MHASYRPMRDVAADAVMLRLRGAGATSADLLRRMSALTSCIESLPAKTMLQTQDDPVQRPRFLLSGWACRFCDLSDGRRQIFDVVLPGEGVGVCLRPNPLANTSTIALTPVSLVNAELLLRPEVFEACPDLLPALQVLAADDERRALNQIVRLGRLAALERMAHLLLELHRRLGIIGQVEGDRLPLPLTQETLADMTGLSVVHVNRTLQELRREKLVQVGRGYARILNRPALVQLADWSDASYRRG